MISVNEALTILAQWVSSNKVSTEVVSLVAATGRVLARDLFSKISMPRFDNSAMDGFAVLSADTVKATTTSPVMLKIKDCVRAGESKSVVNESKYCLKIMTGAVLPKGADAVVKKEDVLEQNGSIVVPRFVAVSENIRFAGEDIKQGDLAVKVGTKISPGTVSFLASIGFKEVPVFKLPRVGLVVTGDELVEDASQLSDGKILDSNSHLLLSLLGQEHIQNVLVIHPHDDPIELKNAFLNLFEKTDLILVTGGVSVGDYDYTRQVLAELGVTELFWKVAQKPGKPLYAGYKEGCLVMGLPGNPYSVFSCYHRYVRFILKKWQKVICEPESFFLPLYQSAKRDPVRHLFLKGAYQIKQGRTCVKILKGQGSHLLRSLIDTQCLVSISPGDNMVSEGEPVEVIPL